MEKHRNIVDKLRRQRGLTQTQLAEMAGLQQSHISKIENQNDGTTIRVFQQIADALGLKLSDLFQDDRAPQELALIEAFRALPPDRQRGWLDMARLVHAEKAPAVEPDFETDRHPVP